MAKSDQQLLRKLPSVDSVLKAEELESYIAAIGRKAVADSIARIERLERVFRFKDFAGALGFANRVGALAEAENHHPAILVEWGRTTVTWWTHKVRGLHRNDFFMAAKTDRAHTGK